MLYGAYGSCEVGVLCGVVGLVVNMASKQRNCELIFCLRHSGVSWLRHPCPSKYRAVFKHVRCIWQLYTEHVIDRCSSAVLLQCTRVGLTSLLGAVAFINGVTGPEFVSMPLTNNNCSGYYCKRKGLRSYNKRYERFRAVWYCSFKG